MAQFWQRYNRGKSVVHSKSELSKRNIYIGRELANAEQIDILATMQTGTRLLKLCSRRTRSHWRRFMLAGGATCIRWESDKKGVNDTTILISNIVDIVCFDAEVLNKFKDTLPDEYRDDGQADQHHDLQHQLFTICYMEENKHKYLSQLSPNHSMTGHHAMTSSHAHPSVIHPQHLHQSKASSSFIRTLRSNPNTPHQNAHVHEESMTDSSSNKSRKGKTHADEQQTPPKYTHTPTDSTTKVVYLNGKDYHLQKVHLMADSVWNASIWIYGLEHLVAEYHKGKRFALYTINAKQLMQFSYEKGRRNANDIPSQWMQETQSTKHRAERINNLLYEEVINQLPEPCKELFLHKQSGNANASGWVDAKPMHYLMSKIKNDQNDLDVILDEIQRQRINAANLQEWKFKLTRIEINIGGYRIGLPGARQMLMSQTNIDSVSEIISYPKHRRERSKSSSLYSTQLVPRNRRTSREHQNGLKYRSPRSLGFESQKADDNHIVRPPPNDAQLLEKFDSV